jgi:hypothetical protein
MRLKSCDPTPIGHTLVFANDMKDLEFVRSRSDALRLLGHMVRHAKLHTAPIIGSFFDIEAKLFCEFQKW